ncbi:hypothetical protein SAMD00019534_072210 [Acytostelium subglobosum LB1]|uniref:hypothetical protein n=1 Tax=Acytostelium subglobosum LB1 TaxID=1410327 RepID=UPI000644C2BA|nr:hypothetical protein SAMD00019534_072210 [Acytostelium subglobosum LB1]GAM24046.1 hypothetical protein SAMD00019534_072210 [Acytostelium subglobosum LB1]|eukprot:XP_012753082.1 hypothetical protein SAMD00019534_072210 [Acytostelium subglobosum LB1]
MKIRYNQELGVLENALVECKIGVMFLCKGETELPMPRIEIKDVGVLSFPVPQVQIQSMIERATRAPFGRGTETITDLNVRRVWQIQNTDINITGKPFQTFFTSITNSIKESMGLTNDTVTAELYKLLVYDKGSFFLPHRDSEKADNMFGTLVLSLPCPHRGGDLVINHSGRDEVVSLENDSMSTIKWTAFFADCRHEVKPVTEGNRVCLVYNLLRSGGRNVQINAASEPITQAFNQVFGRVNNDDANNNDNNYYQSNLKTTTSVASTSNVFDDDDEYIYEDEDEDDAISTSNIPEKLVYSLDHVYSKSNFTLESLKGNDATLARTLLAFSNESMIKLGLAFIQIWEHGPLDHSDDYDETKVPSDTKIILKDVKDMETGAIIERDIRLRTKEIMPSGCIDDLRPYFEEAHEDTGNEGASFERLYRHSAIVIWTSESMGKFTMVVSPDVALEILEKEVAKLGGIDANPLVTQELYYNYCQQSRMINTFQRYFMHCLNHLADCTVL